MAAGLRPIRPTRPHRTALSDTGPAAYKNGSGQFGQGRSVLCGTARTSATESHSREVLAQPPRVLPVHGARRVTEAAPPRGSAHGGCPAWVGERTSVEWSLYARDSVERIDASQSNLVGWSKA